MESWWGNFVNRGADMHLPDTMWTQTDFHVDGTRIFAEVKPAELLAQVKDLRKAVAPAKKKGKRLRHEALPSNVAAKGAAEDADAGVAAPNGAVAANDEADAVHQDAEEEKKEDASVDEADGSRGPRSEESVAVPKMLLDDEE
jgi:hypothetical protein